VSNNWYGPAYSGFLLGLAFLGSATPRIGGPCPLPAVDNETGTGRRHRWAAIRSILWLATLLPAADVFSAGRTNRHPCRESVSTASQQ
jgi:hypothetical protein